MSTTRLFIAYSRKDANLLDELKKYLQPIVLKYDLTIWDDKEIDAGATWEHEIKKNLISADIFLFLITADSLASDYFHNQELTFAIERHKKGEVQIIPIIMRSCGWKHSIIADLQVLPTDGKPVRSSYWPFESEAYTDIVEGIERVLLQKKVEKENQLRAEKEKEINVAKRAEELKKEREQQQLRAAEAEKKKAEEAKKRQEELADWETTKKDNKITVYQKFTRKYPQSEFNETAKNSIKLLRNKNKKAKRKTTPTKKDNSLLKKESPTSTFFNTTKKLPTQLEKEDVLLEKGSVILERSFYASLPIIGAVIIEMLRHKLQIPLIDSVFNSTFLSGAMIIGVIFILIYQLILLIDDYSLIVDADTEIKETIWGVILTLISCGIISVLGILLLTTVFELG